MLAIFSRYLGTVLPALFILGSGAAHAAPFACMVRERLPDRTAGPERLVSVEAVNGAEAMRKVRDALGPRRVFSMDCNIPPHDPRAQPLEATAPGAAPPARPSARAEDQRWFCALRHPGPASAYPGVYIVDTLGARDASHAACRAAYGAEMLPSDAAGCSLPAGAAHCLPVAADPVVDPAQLLPPTLRARPDAYTGPSKRYRCRFDLPGASGNKRFLPWNVIEGDSFPALRQRALDQGSRNGVVRGACMPAETYDALVGAVGG